MSLVQLTVVDFGRFRITNCLLPGTLTGGTCFYRVDVEASKKARREVQPNTFSAVSIKEAPVSQIILPSAFECTVHPSRLFSANGAWDVPWNVVTITSSVLS